MELNLDRINKDSELKEDENFEFRIFLKGQDFAAVDKIVHRLNNEITSKIDCKLCGNCCKSLRPCVSDIEISSMSKIDNLSIVDFESRFVAKEDFEGDKYLKDTPCKYFTNKIFSIYTNRPDDCKSYPHTHKPRFINRTYFMIDHFGICPIVYNVFERLKEELEFDY